jgi:hypothetical protein
MSILLGKANISEDEVMAFADELEVDMDNMLKEIKK